MTFLLERSILLYGSIEKLPVDRNAVIVRYDSESTGNNSEYQKYSEKITELRSIGSFSIHFNITEKSDSICRILRNTVRQFITFNGFGGYITLLNFSDKVLLIALSSGRCQVDTYLLLLI